MLGASSLLFLHGSNFIDLSRRGCTLSLNGCCTAQNGEGKEDEFTQLGDGLFLSFLFPLFASSLDMFTYIVHTVSNAICIYAHLPALFLLPPPFLNLITIRESSMSVERACRIPATATRRTGEEREENGMRVGMGIDRLEHQESLAVAATRVDGPRFRLRLLTSSTSCVQRLGIRGREPRRMLATQPVDLPSR